MAAKPSKAPVGLGGNLCDFGVAEVLQLVGQQRKTGILQVERPRQSSLRLTFDSGRVVWGTPVGEREQEYLGEQLVRCGVLERARLAALWTECEETVQSLRSSLLANGILTPEKLEEFETLLTQETIFMLLQLADGAFSFTPTRVRHEREPASLLGAEQILMDGLRKVDEWAAFASELPSEELVYEISLEPDALVERLEDRFGSDPSSREWAQQILRLIDGQRDVRQVVDRSMLGSFEGMRLFVELIRGGLVEPRVFSASAGNSLSDAPTSSRSLPFAGVASTAIPIALLLALAFFPLRSFFPSPGPEAGVALERDHLAELRVGMNTLRVERELEAVRWSQLDQLRAASPEALLEQADPEVQKLISSEGRPYYHLSEDGRVIPLAPARVVSRTP